MVLQMSSQMMLKKTCGNNKTSSACIVSCGMASVVLSQMRYDSLCTACRPVFCIDKVLPHAVQDVLGHKLIKRSWQ